MDYHSSYLLFHPKAADETGPRLIKELGIAGGHRPPTEGVDTLIRYGSREGLAYPLDLQGNFPKRVINSIEAISRATDKRGSLLTFMTKGVKAPYPMLYPYKNLPAVGRKKRHERGYGFWLCLQKADVERALAEGADYFIKYIPTRGEYRVHVVGGLVPFMQQKEFTGKGKKALSPWLRNKRMGWRLVRCPEIPRVCKLGIGAVEALGLDFGAVDILRDDNDRLWVLEVNTAPALRGSQLRDWCETFKRRFLE